MKSKGDEMENIIQVQDLSKSYGDIEAVKGISFDVKRGAFFAFLGPNGAGKSTTIEMMCTFLSPSSGKILIAGDEVGIDNAQIRENIGVVFQNNVLDNLLTVEENLQLRGKLYGKKGANGKVWEMIKKMQEENDLTIFLTTHYMEEAAQTDQIIILDQGKIEEEGSPSELKEKYAKNKLVFTPKNDQLAERLVSDQVPFEHTGETLTIIIDQTLDAIELSQKYREDLESYEVLKGSMDDVFLNVTGRELR